MVGRQGQAGWERRARWVVLALGLVAGLGWLAAPIKSAAQREGGLWFAIRVTPGLVEWFNETARPRDIALVQADAADWVDQITSGRIQVTFSSVADAEAAVPLLADRIDIVGYDLEHLQATPVEEQDDPQAALARVHDVAKAHGLATALVTDRRFAETYGAELARYADLVILPGQRLQGDGDALQRVMQPLIGELRGARPDGEIGVQLRSESLEHTYVVAHSLEESIEGIAVLYSPASPEAAQAFVGEIVSDRLGAHSVPTPAEARARPSPTAEASSAQAAEVLPPQAVPLLRCTWPTGLVMGGSGWVLVKTRRRRRQAGRSPGPCDAADH